MNLFVLLAGFRIWKGPPLSMLSRLFAAIALLAIEMQAVTWLRAGSLRWLLVLNAIVAAVALVLWRRDDEGSAARRALPWPAVAGMGLLALTLNLARPLEAADPYHLERVDQILRFGTLEYDPNVDPKTNVLGWVYELMLADLHLVPLIGPALVRLHGVIGLLLYSLTIAAIREWLPGGKRWCWTALLVMPVVFHQFVLVKNDLFGALPAFVALCWVIVRVRTASVREVVWASALVGAAVAVKVTTFPLALVTIAAVAADKREWRAIAAVVLGGVFGGVAGGLMFTLVQNARWYGDPLAPLAAFSNHHTTTAEALAGIGRFTISLFDLGLLTRTWWPGRGGWGSTYGLPFIWAVMLLLATCRRAPEARRALWAAGFCFAAFAAVYRDADVAHRMALAPGLMIVAVAVHLASGDDESMRRWRSGLVFVIVLSIVQITRSAVLYLTRA